MEYFKYPRTPHLPWSRPTSDDKKLVDDSQFHGQNVVVTLKMDGENTSMYEDKYHARSIDSNNHYTRNYVKGVWGRIKHDLKGLRLCGENLWAEHTIKYNDLEDYFYAFSIWEQDGNYCFDWLTSCMYFDLLEVKHVPVFYTGVYDKDKIHQLYLDNHSNHEGYVIRNVKAFDYEDFASNVAKFVKPSFSDAVHASTKHWLYDVITPNKLKSDVEEHGRPLE